MASHYLPYSEHYKKKNLVHKSSEQSGKGKSALIIVGKTDSIVFTFIKNHPARTPVNKTHAILPINQSMFLQVGNAVGSRPPQKV